MQDGNIVLLLILIVVCIFAVWLHFKLKKERKQRDRLSRDNARLIADNALLLNEHLKFQLQPHTLNNILANLKVFSNKLNKGLDSLSATLEYIIYKGNNHMVSVQDELEFVKQYLALNDLFTDEIDAISVDSTQVLPGSRYYYTPGIPHLITAYFIENAFKHGDVHHPNFLKIELALDDGMFAMRVVNKIKKQPSTSSGGLGLRNMKERLDLLLPGRYEIRNSANEQEYTSHLIIRF